MSQRIYKAIESLLTVLMTHIIKWIDQPEKRSKSWSETIEKTRSQITDYQENKPSANMSFLLKIWDKVFNKAKKQAEKEMNKKSETESLTKEQVFEENYKI